MARSFRSFLAPVGSDICAIYPRNEAYNGQWTIGNFLARYLNKGHLNNLNVSRMYSNVFALDSPVLRYIYARPRNLISRSDLGTRRNGNTKDHRRTFG
jgi:hypothetical protein